MRQRQQLHQPLIQIQVHRREIKASLLVKCVEIRHQVINADAMRCLFDLCAAIKRVVCAQALFLEHNSILAAKLII